MKLRIVLTGSESLLIHCGEAVRGRGHELVCVVSREPAVVAWAHGCGVVTHSDYEPLFTHPGGFDYLLSVGNLELVPPPVLALAQLGAFNFHDGPLPRYAGLHAPVWALWHEETRHGICWHRMERTIDAGAIVVHRDFDIAQRSTAFTLSGACYGAAIASFPELLGAMEDGRAEGRPQDLHQRTWFGKYKRPEGAGTLRFDLPAARVLARARALDFGPIENPLGLPKLWTGQRFVIVGAAVEGPATTAPAGTVSVAGDRIEIATAHGSVWLSSLQTGLGPITADEVARELGPRAPLIADEQALRWQTLAQEAAPSEPFWRRRLGELVPPESLSAHPIGTPHPLSTARQQVSPPHTSLPPQRAVALTFLAFLARRTARNRLDVAIATARGPLFLPYRPLRVSVDPDAPISAALEGIGVEWEEAMAHGPLAVDLCARTPSLDPQVIALLHRVVLHLDAEPSGADVCPGELAVHIWPDGDGVTWYLTHKNSGELEALISQFATFVAASQAEPALPLRSLTILTEDARRQLHDWATGPSAPVPTTPIHGLIGNWAQHHAGNVAVDDGDTVLTYEELVDRSGALAAALQGEGVGPDVRVGVHLHRTTDLVVAVVAILRAGGAFLPLDPAYPAARIAFMLEDSGCDVIVTSAALRAHVPTHLRTVLVESSFDPAVTDHASAPTDLAYQMYTSGSTGQPKGVLVEHRNLSNFLVAMDERVPGPYTDGAWLAVTSLNFDICILELLWTLSRGFRVLLHSDTADGRGAAVRRAVDFSLMFFASDEGASDDAADKYKLLLASAKFGDSHGFAAVWTPERHFHAFGGLYPNPSVTSAAIAAVTERIQIRAGSVVAPLHSPIRIAEEWALVDNLSGGRVGVSFASGWQPQDFVLAPENFADRKAKMFTTMDTVQRLWRGEAVEFATADGTAEIRTLPRPVQPELPTWITAAGNPATFAAAGRAGANVLTHLLGQSVRELAEKVGVYRAAWADAGHSGRGVVTLMLHTFVGESDDEVRDQVREAMKAYLGSAMDLIARAAWSFPTFRHAADRAGRTPGETLDAKALSPDEREALLEGSFARYFETSGLFGAPATCLRMVERVCGAGVDEIACLLDYGLPTAEVLDGLTRLDAVRRAAQAPARPVRSVASRIREGRVTHLQCTPSQMTLLLADPETEPALRTLRALLLGGEALPPGLAERLAPLPADVLNMYGPTETTIWSATAPVHGPAVSLGQPIANTSLRVEDAWGNLVPIGAAGELLIGGHGVVRGYHHRDAETARRFVVRGDARFYVTGDQVRWERDGRLSFLGRVDNQIKWLGHRIEPGEIEAHIARLDGVEEAVVTVTDGSPGRLVAYARTTNSGVTAGALLNALRAQLPAHLVPSTIVLVDELPRTANGKLDRRHLPAVESRPGEPTGDPPKSEVEIALAAIWRELLDVDSIGLHDNFFDLGGNSLMAVQMHRLIDERTSYPLHLTDLFRFPTVGALAHFVAEGENTTLAPSADRAAARKKALSARRRRR